MTTPSASHPHRLPNWRLLIPFFMLLLAVLACDENYIAPPVVSRIEADPDRPGYAFASTVHDDTISVYETADYGQNWHLSNHVFTAPQNNSYPLQMRRETIYLNDRAIWSFPRPNYRSFFLEENITSPRFQLPSPTAANSAQGDTVYIAMGTQGVLVGRMTASGTLEDWELRANGIDTIDPLPLTIQDPWSIIGVVAFALLVPPGFLLHGFLLYCLWVYVLPREEAKRNAILATGVLMLAAAAGVAYWLTTLKTDFYPMVAAVTIFSVLLNAGLTMSFANRAAEGPRPRWLVLAAVIASLIVPAGIATIFVGWWAVYLLVLGYGIHRRLFRRLFGGETRTWHERWLADRLAIETTLVSAVAAGLLLAALWVLQIIISRFVPYGGASLLQLGTVLVLIGILSVLSRRYTAYRLRNLEKRKRDEAGDELMVQAVRDRIQLTTLLWMATTVIVSGATFFGQMIAYGWFTSLLKT